MASFLGYVGVAMMIILIAWVWMNRLSRTASSAGAPVGHDGVESEPVSHRRSSPEHSLTPQLVSPQNEASSAPKAERQAVDAEQMTEPEAVESIHNLPDSESAREQLQIASQLQMIGDFEGATQYANLVIEDDSASERQKIQAENLIRRARTR